MSRAMAHRTSASASLTLTWILYPSFYPILTVCLTCHREIRDGWLMGEWYHTEPEPE